MYHIKEIDVHTLKVVLIKIVITLIDVRAI